MYSVLTAQLMTPWGYSGSQALASDQHCRARCSRAGGRALLGAWPRVGTATPRARSLDVPRVLSGTQAHLGLGRVVILSLLPGNLGAVCTAAEPSPSGAQVWMGCSLTCPSPACALLICTRFLLPRLAGVGAEERDIELADAQLAQRRPITWPQGAGPGAPAAGLGVCGRTRTQDLGARTRACPLYPLYCIMVPFKEIYL